jgi:hypothetical protein
MGRLGGEGEQKEQELLGRNTRLLSFSYDMDRIKYAKAFGKHRHTAK